MGSDSPQLEDGFTQIANELLEAIYQFKFNGTQFRIILVIWRYTYGFKRKQHEFSLTFIANATGIHKNQIDRELNALIEQQVVTVISEATYTKSRVLRVNKNYKFWLEKGESAKTLTVSELGDSTVSELGDTGVSELVDQEINLLNKLFKERYICMDSIPFKEIIDYLNQKAGKRFSHKSAPTRKLISGRFTEGRTLEDFKYVIDVKVSHWKDKPDMNGYLRPSTLFRPTNFENYLNQGEGASNGKFDSDSFLDSLEGD